MEMTGDHPPNTGPMLSSQRCGAKTRSGKAVDRQPFKEKNDVGCMAGRRDPGPRGAIKMHRSTDSIRAKPLLNGGIFPS
jgi:hypothetical protein